MPAETEINRSIQVVLYRSKEYSVYHKGWFGHFELVVPYAGNSQGNTGATLGRNLKVNTGPSHGQEKL